MNIAVCSPAMTLHKVSSATLKAGGLKFTKTGAVEMVAEDLYLSMGEVRVHYVFRNKTAKDVTALVAFPMPRLGAQFWEEPVAIPEPGTVNFMRFKTRVDGKAQTPQLVQRATIGARDVTAQLVAANLPLSPVDPKLWDALKKLPPAKAQALVKAKLIEKISVDPDPADYRGLWALDTAFTRTQVFPAGQDVIVDHSYAPIVGGSVESMLLIDSMPQNSPELRRLKQNYCVDPAFDKAGHVLSDRFGGAEHVQERRLDYVLKTGANWAGPIGKFHLTIDKGAADNLVSTCLPDLKKTGATTFELTRANFRPTTDLALYFLVPSKGE